LPHVPLLILHTYTVDTNSRSQLEQEYLFIDVVSTFLRAIRAGALHVRHSAVLLAYNGQLGPSFDMCSRVVVEVLREEGMINDRGEVVVDVLTNALREARNPFNSLRNDMLTLSTGVYSGVGWCCS
jgi:hypothetical protein